MNKIQYIFLLLILVLVSSILFVGSYAIADPEFPNKVDARIVTINGIKLGDSEGRIIKKLGKPDKIETGFSEAITKNTKYLHYKGLKIYLTEDEMLNLSCKHSCITDKGIKIGSTIKQVFDAYGVDKDSKDQASYIFWVPEGFIGAYLMFHFENGVVNEIEFWVDYI